MVKLVLFDIDGTLIRTGGAGMHAFERTGAVAFEVPDGVRHLSFAGRTDTSLVREFFVGHRIEATPGNFTRFFDHYVFLLDHLLPQHVGAVCPGVPEFLDGLRALLPAPLVGLQTGNIRLGAEIKLRHYGLWHRFEIGGFGDDDEDRRELTRIAWERARRRFPSGLRPEEVLVIGDTPHDIDCARTLGARVVAVATGGTSPEELSAHGPDWLVSDLTENPRGGRRRLSSFARAPGPLPRLSGGAGHLRSSGYTKPGFRCRRGLPQCRSRRRRTPTTASRCGSSRSGDTGSPPIRWTGPAVRCPVRRPGNGTHKSAWAEPSLSAASRSRGRARFYFHRRPTAVARIRFYPPHEPCGAGFQPALVGSQDGCTTGERGRTGCGAGFQPASPWFMAGEQVRKEQGTSRGVPSGLGSTRSMADALSELAKTLSLFLQPLAALWVGLVLVTLRRLGKRQFRSALCPALVAAFLYLLGATPLPASLLASLERPYAGVKAGALPPADAVVMLGGIAMPSTNSIFDFHLGPGADRVMAAIELVRQRKGRELVLGGGLDRVSPESRRGRVAAPLDRGVGRPAGADPPAGPVSEHAGRSRAHPSAGRSARLGSHHPRHLRRAHGTSRGGCSERSASRSRRLPAISKA